LARRPRPALPEAENDEVALGKICLIGVVAISLRGAGIDASNAREHHFGAGSVACYPDVGELCVIGSSGAPTIGSRSGKHRSCECQLYGEHTWSRYASSWPAGDRIWSPPAN